MDQTNIMFNDSNLYFQNPEILQSKIGFANPLDIDIYVKKSFSVLDQQVVISWWYIQTFNKNHIIDEFFNCYKIQLANGQPIIPSKWIIKFDLENAWVFGTWLIQGIIQGTPIISILLLTLVSFLFPASVAVVLRYISVIWILITILYFAYKFIKSIIKTLKSKWIDYNWVNILYENVEDIFNISPEYVETLKQLRKDLKITQIVLFEWVFYLKQTIRKTTIRQSILNVFIWQEVKEEKVQEEIQNTLNFILTTQFISTYNTPTIWQQPL